MSEHEAKAQDMTARARAAARALAGASTADKNRALHRIAEALQSPDVQAKVIAANDEDLHAAREAGLSEAMIDRLRLDGGRLSSLGEAVKEIEQLEDPVGAIEDLRARPSGIQVGRMRVPLGTILIVYESRPNVTVDAAALCMKAGNAVILRGGKEARRSNAALAEVVREALKSVGLPEDAALLVDTPERELLYALLGRSGEIDLAIPRGGTSLIDAVNEHARVPVVQHYQGICHVYVHEAADLMAAGKICVNAKVQRPGVCNSAEGIVVDEAVAEDFVPRVVRALKAHHVEVRGCEKTRAIAGDDVVAATPEDFDTEFLSLVCTLKVVDGYDEAIDFIAEHGSGHTESIVTQDHGAAMDFLRRVDASCVLINASTRFNDGGELGLGAELGISTTKLHAYGPMGLEELTARKFVVLGDGQTRGSPP
jgi:glutamate-5-semialdehyde dehydrogenase